MSKDEFENDPAEENGGGSSGLGKEAKIGVTVIAVLVVGLGVALTYRLMRSAPEEQPEAPAIAQSDNLKLPDHKKDKPKSDASKLFDGIKTKVVPAAAASTSVTKPDLGKSDRWKTTSDDDQKRRHHHDDASPASPPSFSLDASKSADAVQRDRYSSDAPTSNRYSNDSPRHRYDPAASHDDTSGFSMVEAAPPPPPVPEDSDDGKASPARLHRDPPTSFASENRSAPAMPIGQSDDRRWQHDRSAYGNDNGSLHRPPSASLHGNPVARRNDGKYEVQPNDNFWTISEKLYGTGAYFKALAQHNSGKDNQEDLLQPGNLIDAPELAELEKSYPDLCPKAERRDAMQSQNRSRTSTVSTRNQLSNRRTYTVVEGDTLFDIARYELGKASRWAEIYDLNREVLGKDFNYIAPGTQLVMPDGGKTDIIAEPPSNRYRR